MIRHFTKFHKKLFTFLIGEKIFFCNIYCYTKTSRNYRKVQEDKYSLQNNVSSNIFADFDLSDNIRQPTDWHDASFGRHVSKKLTGVAKHFWGRTGYQVLHRKEVSLSKCHRQRVQFLCDKLHVPTVFYWNQSHKAKHNMNLNSLAHHSRL